MPWLSRHLLYAELEAMEDGWWMSFLTFLGDLGYEMCPPRLRRRFYPQDSRDADLIVNDGGDSTGAGTGGQD